MSRPIRAVFCHHTSDVGGGSDRSLFDLVTRLPRDRFASLVILRTGDPLAAAYRASGVEVFQTPLVHPRRTRSLGPHLRFLAAYGPAVARIAAAIRRFDADLVHVNTMNNLQGPAAAILCRRPLVWHIREVSTGRAGRVIAGLVERMATRIVANSTATAAAFASCGDRVRVVPNGIDLGEYHDLPAKEDAREALGVDPGVPLAVTIGRLEPWKGQHVFIEAVPRIRERHPGARFLVVGGPAVNKPDYMPALQDRCRELGISSAVTFTGPRRDVPTLLAACDVLVLPSVLPEPFGRTLVEAMAAARPVVATAAGGPLEIVEDGETGLLVPPEDANALAGAVSRLFADPQQAAEMGERGRRRAHAHYSLERLVADMAALLSEVCRADSRM